MHKQVGVKHFKNKHLLQCQITNASPFPGVQSPLVCAYVKRKMGNRSHKHLLALGVINYDLRNGGRSRSIGHNIYQYTGSCTPCQILSIFVSSSVINLHNIYETPTQQTKEEMHFCKKNVHTCYSGKSPIHLSLLISNYQDFVHMPQRKMYQAMRDAKQKQWAFVSIRCH